MQNNITPIILYKIKNNKPLFNLKNTNKNK